MKKAVAIPYIIALILGVGIVALLGTWFATSGGKFSGQSSKTLCDTKFLRWCVVNPTGTYDSFKTGTECANIGGSFQKCDEILGSKTPSPSPAGSGDQPVVKQPEKPIQSGQPTGSSVVELCTSQNLESKCKKTGGGEGMCQGGSVSTFVAPQPPFCG